MAAVLAGLAAYLYFVEFPAEREKLRTDTQAKRLLTFEERDITGLTVHSPSLGPDIVLAPDDKRNWTITAPVRTDADAREVGDLLRALLLGTVTRVIEEQAASLAPFGLEQPAVMLTIAAGDRRETLSLGDIGPISSTLYAMRASDKQVLLTDLPPKILLNRTLTSLRRKEVLTVQQDLIERLRVSNPKTEVMLERFDEKEKKLWRVRFPIEAKADQPAIRNLVIKLAELKALAFVDAGADRDKLAARLGQPLIKITATIGGTDHVVKLYQPDPASGEAYAVTAPDAPIYKVNPTAIRDFTKDLFTLQDKRLLGMEMDQIAMLSVKTRGERYVLIHQNDEWMMEDQPTRELNQQTVNLFVARVIDLPAEFRVVRDPGPLAPYGLSSPAAEFVSTARDGKTKNRLVLGNKTSGLVYAMGSNLTGIFQARADLLNQIPDKDSLFAKTAGGKNQPPD
ncbi:MAG: hypothetical protein A3A88_07220 [Nitrospirae bacterium RIFCSPLOWO2_01_FULL_62_17]|nr:MAG: hypothetical protein A3A88_07220 [Nitrospirae bacterium RIFCSPLOWO2_01_FULL_62_17]